MRAYIYRRFGEKRNYENFGGVRSHPSHPLATPLLRYVTLELPHRELCGYELYEHVYTDKV